MITSQGASNSDQPFLQALFATLAAFQPETKARLTEAGLIAPTLQMLLRRHYAGGGDDAHYLSNAAHPVIFNGESIGLEAMVDHAQPMLPENIPPQVVMEGASEPEASIRIGTPSERVDIGVFAFNGHEWSAPAILSVTPN